MRNNFDYNSIVSRPSESIAVGAGRAEEMEYIKPETRTQRIAISVEEENFTTIKVAAAAAANPFCLHTGNWWVVVGR